MVELIFAGKVSKSSLLLKANTYQSSIHGIEGNLLIKGDNLYALHELLSEYRGKIDLVYIDPPYNTSKDFMIGNGKTNAMSYHKGDSVAYSDKFSVDGYMQFMWERLFLLRELLSPIGSIYIHIDQKYGHYIKILADEIFGRANFKNDIARIKCNPKSIKRSAYGNYRDMVLFYAKDGKQNIWNEVRCEIPSDAVDKRYFKSENGKAYYTVSLHAPGETLDGETGKPWRGLMPPRGRHWCKSHKEMDELDAKGMIEWSSTGNPRLKMYKEDYKGDKIQDVWVYKDPPHPSYPTEKNSDMLDMIISQSSNPNSIVLDCFTGSGSTLRSADRLGRRWIGIDQSDASIRTISESDMKYTFIDMGGL